MGNPIESFGIDIKLEILPIIDKTDIQNTLGCNPAFRVYIIMYIRNFPFAITTEFGIFAKLIRLLQIEL